MKVKIISRRLRELREWMDMTLGYPPDRIGLALEKLWGVDNTAYRIIRERKSGFLRRAALKLKTRALIQHDRILRGEQ